MRKMRGRFMLFTPPLPRLEGDGEPARFETFLDRDGGKRHVGEEEPLGDVVEHGAHRLRFHEAEGGVGVGHRDMECHLDHGFQHLGYHLAGETVLPRGAEPDLEVVVRAFAPEWKEFLRIGLPVGICLENIVGAVVEGMPVEHEQSGAMSGVGLVDRMKIRKFVAQLAEALPCGIARSVVGDEQHRLRALFGESFGNGMPLLNHRVMLASSL